MKYHENIPKNIMVIGKQKMLTENQVEIRKVKFFENLVLQYLHTEIQARNEVKIWIRGHTRASQ